MKLSNAHFLKEKGGIWELAFMQIFPIKVFSPPSKTTSSDGSRLIIRPRKRPEQKFSDGRRFLSFLESRCKKLLTIDDHWLLHKIFVDKTADFAAIHPTQLRGWLENFDSPVFTKFITASHLVREV